MELATGLFLVLLAGVISGSFYVPATYTKKWEWEHSWLVFSLTGMFIFNWIFIMISFPAVFEVFKEAPQRDILIIVVSGMIWGIGGILTGLAMDRLGMALAFPIVLGIIASFGAFIPLVVFFSQEIFSLKGVVLTTGTLTSIIGVIICSRAFSLKQPDGEKTDTPKKGSLKTKIIIAVMAGLMSSLMNVGFSFGVSLIETAKNLGASEAFAGNAAWLVILTSGGIFNVGYCIYLMAKRSTFRQFFGPATVRNLGLGSIMGFLWCTALYMYGLGAANLGKWGVVIGWVLYISTNMMTGNLWGLLRGEWKGAPAKARKHLNVGLMVFILAIIIVAVSDVL
jgi:L-rhamnose-H+ transport protein